MVEREGRRMGNSVAPDASMADEPLDVESWRFKVDPKHAMGLGLDLLSAVNSLRNALYFLPTIALWGASWLSSSASTALTIAGAAVLLPSTFFAHRGWTNGLQRIEAIARGTPIFDKNLFWAPTEEDIIKSNAGRTLTPEFAQYQGLLDRAALDKQAHKPRFLATRNRHPRGAPGGKGGQFR